MHDIFDYMAQHKHERLCLTADPVSGLQVVIALHNTILGPALG